MEYTIKYSVIYEDEGKLKTKILDTQAEAEAFAETAHNPTIFENKKYADGGGESYNLRFKKGEKQ